MVVRRRRRTSLWLRVLGITSSWIGRRLLVLMVRRVLRVRLVSLALTERRVLPGRLVFRVIRVRRVLRGLMGLRGLLVLLG